MADSTANKTNAVRQAAEAKESGARVAGAHGYSRLRLRRTHGEKPPQLCCEAQTLTAEHCRSYSIRCPGTSSSLSVVYVYMHALPTFLDLYKMGRTCGGVKVRKHRARNAGTVRTVWYSFSCNRGQRVAEVSGVQSRGTPPIGL